MTSTNNKIAVGYNGNQLDKMTLNIDYLIINLVGNLDLYKTDFGANNILIEANSYGTKIFQSSHFIYYYGIKMGTLLSNPRSTILNQDLCQFQFDNNLFYTNELNELKDFLNLFCDITNLHFQSINRLDICLDKCDKTSTYRKLMYDIINGTKLISGRSKNVRNEYLTINGRMVLNGFTIGKRSASRFLRVYNKTLEMSIKPKEYIYQNWQNNNIDTTSVWRFEYQLNNTFFTYLRKSQKENITWNLFDKLMLLELIQKAEKNHFEVHENTNKAETNKEKKISIFDWQLLKTFICTQRKVILNRIKHTISNSFLVYKRYLKSNFRQYYTSKQNIAFILPLNQFFEDFTNIDEYNLLYKWFLDKVPYYLKEFQQIDIAKNKFDYNTFLNHLKIYI